MSTNNFMSNQNLEKIVELVPNFSAQHQIMRWTTHLIPKWRNFNVDAFLLIVMAILCLIPQYMLWELQTILTDSLDFSTTTAASIVNVYDGFKGIFGILGAIAIDAYFTDYGMIFIASIFYSVGLVILSIGLSKLAYTSKYTSKYVVVCGLIPIAVAKYSLMNSLNALLLESMKERTVTVIKAAFNVAITLLFAFLPGADSPRRDFVISSVAMLLVSGLSLVNLIRNSPVKHRGDRRNPLKYVVRVYFAAFLKRQGPPPEADKLYCGEPDYPLEHTTDTHGLLSFLDKAAVKETSNPEEERNNWLCTVTEVEETKCLVHMFPICTTFLAYGMVKSIGDTFFLDQGSNMDTTIGQDDTEIPIQVFWFLQEFTRSVTIILYNVLISKKLPATGKRYAPAIEYAMGMVLLSLCCSVASWVEMEVYETRGKKHRMSIFWLTPQFLIYGAMGGLAGEGIQDFFSGQLPPSMTQYAEAFADGITGAGSFFAIFLVFITKTAFRWFEEDEDKHFKLYKFYHFCTVVGITIFFAYAWAAVRYNYRDNTEIKAKRPSRVEDENNVQESESNQHKYLSQKSLHRRPSSHQSLNIV